MSLRKFNNYDLDGFAPVLAWNPLAMRCTPVNEGCRNCWHLEMADRLAKNPVISRGMRLAYEGRISCVATAVAFEELPKGRIIAVQFMGDLWHEKVSRAERFDLLSKAECVESIFLLLTKRPENVTERIPDNCWMGVSAHDGPSTIEAMKALGKIKAKHKWLSLEPLLDDVREKCDGLNFIAYGPETVGGMEQRAGLSHLFWVRWSLELGGAGVAMYDKRKEWTVREWPEEWKRVCKKVPCASGGGTEIPAGKPASTATTTKEGGGL